MAIASLDLDSSEVAAVMDRLVQEDAVLLATVRRADAPAALVERLEQAAAQL